MKKITDCSINTDIYNNEINYQYIGNDTEAKLQTVLDTINNSKDEIVIQEFNKFTKLSNERKLDKLLSNIDNLINNKQ